MPKRVDFALKLHVFPTRILQKCADDKGVNATLHQTWCVFFRFFRKSEVSEACFVVPQGGGGADFLRRLAGPKKLRWNMHGLSMRVSG
jgi:hypothetical protein